MKSYRLLDPTAQGRPPSSTLSPGSTNKNKGISFLSGFKSGTFPHQICDIGIARTFQTTRLFKHLSVLENLKVGVHTRTGYRFWDEILRTRRLKQREGTIERQALSTSSTNLASPHFGRNGWKSPLWPAAPCRDSSISQLFPRLLMLDEPAAGMNPQEALHLMGVVREDQE